MKDTKIKVAASVVVHRIPDMTDRGRREICQWLRKLAREIQSHPEAYGKVFRARYLYNCPRERKP